MLNAEVALTPEQTAKIEELQDDIQELNRKIQEIEEKKSALRKEFIRFLDDIACANIEEYAEWKKTHRGSAYDFAPALSADNCYLSIIDTNMR